MGESPWVAGGRDGCCRLSRRACDWCVAWRGAPDAVGNAMLTTAALLFLILETRNDYVRFHGKCLSHHLM